MKRTKILVVALLGIALVVLSLRRSDLQSSQEAARPGLRDSLGKQIEVFELQDYLGATHTLAQWQDKKAVVVAFLGTECPLAKLYAQRLVELDQKYASQGVQLVGIVSNRQDTLAEMAHYARIHQVEFPLLKDPGNKVADQFGALRTPEVFLLDEERVVRYRGRVDDQYGVGFSRPAATHSDLGAALDELLAGKPISHPQVEAVGCLIGRVDRGEPTGEITYSNQIVRIVNNRCASCHREGQVAPFALTSYEETSAWAETMWEVIEQGRMPPWHANPEHGKFLNDARMVEDEKQMFRQWVENGVPEGDPANLPEPLVFVDDWQIPEPDVVYRMPEPFEVPATGVVPYQHFYLDPGFTEDKWVRASEARPGNRSVVHHLILFYLPPGQERHRPEDPLFKAIAAFAPGMPALEGPEGYATRIPAGSKLVFQVHYTPNGSPQTDISEAGLIFSDPAKVKREMAVQAALNFRFLIPPGDKNYAVNATYRVAEDSLLYSLVPHMHYRGKSFRFTAKYPDGTREILLDVPNYDFNWQNAYLLKEPKFLPEATKILMQAKFDNSAENLLNPDPTRAVHWGDQTWDEMMIGTMVMSDGEQDLTLGPPRVEALEDGKSRVHFRYRPRAAAKTVHLAGSFNDWQRDKHLLEGPDAEGWYTTSLDLDPGSHEYKFVLDGTRWRADPGNHERTGDYRNSVVRVE